MKRLMRILVPAVLLALAAMAVPSAGVSSTLNYSDPASDVVQLWSSNMTPVYNAGGEPVMSPFPDAINILWLRSSETSGGENVTLRVETKGSIADLSNTTYEFRLYSRADNASHFVVTYTNGVTVLGSNDTGFTPKDISRNSTISAIGPNPTIQNALTINVNKTLLGTIDAWNIDGIATQSGPTYTYRDFGWEVPGNPGSAPPTQDAGGLFTNWVWIALAIAVAIIAIVALIAIRRRKSAPPPPPAK